MTPNTQPQHSEDNQAPKTTRAFKAPTFGITDEMVQESINKVLAMSGKAAEEASRIWREQEEEIKLLNHPVTIRINKYKKQFKDDPENLKLLNGMEVIAEDELQLIDGTVVKLGYPDIKADNKEIFERMVKDTEGKEIRAVYFTNKKYLFIKNAFEKYQEEMKQKGFRIVGNENDISGEIAKRENQRIFGMIIKEGTPNHNTIIVDILGRAFSDYLGADGILRGGSHVENLWSGTSTYSEDKVHYCYLNSGSIYPEFSIIGRGFGFGALFFQDKKTD